MEDAQNRALIPAAPAANPQVEIKRGEKTFLTGYANSVIVESNAFDLKLIFGLYDHRDAASPKIDQFSSMNIPWPMVKLLIFWMQVHLAGHERENGKVDIPASAIPPEPPATLPTQFNTPNGHEALEAFRKMRAQFVASLSKP